MISGKVKYHGQLLPSGQVGFYDSRDRQLATASINPDGSYSATVPSGTLKIAVSTLRFTPRSFLPAAKKNEIREKAKKMKKEKYVDPFEGENEEPPAQKAITIPTKYADPVNSGLSLTVTGGPQSFDIDLP